MLRQVIIYGVPPYQINSLEAVIKKIQHGAKECELIAEENADLPIFVPCDLSDVGSQGIISCEIQLKIRTADHLKMRQFKTLVHTTLREGFPGMMINDPVLITFQ